jgi:hypothetical protein
MTHTSASVDLTLTHKDADYQCTLHAEGYVTLSGSNGYGSDDPEACEVEGVTLYNGRGCKVSARVQSLLTARDWDAITSALTEDA